MCKIIFIGNYKGGVGKTTTTINLAQYFSDSQKKILTIDLDPKCRIRHFGSYAEKRVMPNKTE